MLLWRLNEKHEIRREANQTGKLLQLRLKGVYGEVFKCCATS